MLLDVGKVGLGERHHMHLSNDVIQTIVEQKRLSPSVRWVTAIRRRNAG